MSEHRPDQREIFLTLHRTIHAPVETVNARQSLRCARSPRSRWAGRFPSKCAGRTGSATSPVGPTRRSSPTAVWSTPDNGRAATWNRWSPSNSSRRPGTRHFSPLLIHGSRSSKRATGTNRTGLAAWSSAKPCMPAQTSTKVAIEDNPAGRPIVKLHYPSLSTCSQKVLIALDEKGAAFESEQVRLFDDTDRARALPQGLSAGPHSADGARRRPPDPRVLDHRGTP